MDGLTASLQTVGHLSVMHGCMVFVCFFSQCHESLFVCLALHVRGCTPLICVRISTGFVSIHDTLRVKIHEEETN